MRPSSIIDLLAFLPFLMGLFSSDAFLLRLLRLLRILTLAKLGRYSQALRLLLTAVRARQYEIKMAGAVSATALLLSSTALYLIEGDDQPKAFGSIPRALWWAVATLTTVGYGDVYPASTAGKIAAGFTAIAGIGVIALPSGILAAAFSEAFRRELKERANPPPPDAGA